MLLLSLESILITLGLKENVSSCFSRSILIFLRLITSSLSQNEKSFVSFFSCLSRQFAFKTFCFLTTCWTLTRGSRRVYIICPCRDKSSGPLPIFRGFQHPGSVVMKNTHKDVRKVGERRPANTI